MNYQQWAIAAELYETRRQQQEQEAAQASRNRQNNAAAEEQKSRDYQADIIAGTKELDDFLASKAWEAGQKLLLACGQHINIAEEREGGGYGVVYFLDGNCQGTQQSVEAMGMWTAYSRDVKKPRISPASSREAVALAVRQGAKPNEIVPTICKKLDRIAKQVLPKNPVANRDITESDIPEELRVDACQAWLPVMLKVGNSGENPSPELRAHVKSCSYCQAVANWAFKKSFADLLELKQQSPPSNEL